MFKPKALFFIALIVFFSAWFSIWQVDWIATYRDYWHAPITMVFGSFVAGSTPLGGGAVSFPVFSKLLAATSYEARSFGFLIQSVGMSFATLFFILWRIPVNWRWVAYTCVGSFTGIYLGLTAFSYSDSLVKLSFSLFALAAGVLLVSSRSTRSSLPPISVKPTQLITVGFLGGLLSSQVGAGADTLLFFYLVLILRREPRDVIPTTVVVMAASAIVGAVLTALYHPQFITSFVWGSWLTAAPIVAIGASAGGWVMSRLKPRPLLVLIKCVLLFEACSTLLFVELPIGATIALFSLILVSMALLTRMILSGPPD